MTRKQIEKEARKRVAFYWSINDTMAVNAGEIINQAAIRVREIGQLLEAGEMGIEEFLNECMICLEMREFGLAVKVVVDVGEA